MNDTSKCRIIVRVYDTGAQRWIDIYPINEEGDMYMIKDTLIAALLVGGDGERISTPKSNVDGCAKIVS